MSVDGTDSPDTNSNIYGQLIINKDAKTIRGGIVSSTNGARTTGSAHTKERSWTPISLKT